LESKDPRYRLREYKKSSSPELTIRGGDLVVGIDAILQMGTTLVAHRPVVGNPSF
jgi:hypothetical protein